MTYDDEVNAALKESIKTKEIEDLRRKGKDLYVVDTIQKEAGALSTKEVSFLEDVVL